VVEQVQPVALEEREAQLAEGAEELQQRPWIRRPN
jgi:hypothetical protein